MITLAVVECASNCGEHVPLFLTLLGLLTKEDARLNILCIVTRIYRRLFFIQVSISNKHIKTHIYVNQFNRLLAMLHFSYIQRERANILQDSTHYKCQFTVSGAMKLLILPLLVIGVVVVVVLVLLSLSQSIEFYR